MSEQTGEKGGGWKGEGGNQTGNSPRENARNAKNEVSQPFLADARWNCHHLASRRSPQRMGMIRKEINQPMLLALRDKLRQTIGCVEVFWAELPDSWVLDHGEMLPAELTKARVYSVLNRLDDEWDGVWL